MLERFQVMLPDWLSDYINQTANRYDLSVSELIRIEICVAIIYATSIIYPDFKKLAM